MCLESCDTEISIPANDVLVRFFVVVLTTWQGTLGNRVLVSGDALSAAIFRVGSEGGCSSEGFGVTVSTESVSS